ncbi:MAG: anti-sigma factor family protein [Pseudonocardia sp.]
MRQPRDMACRELVELVTDYLEGALPPDEVAAVEAHLDECGGCREYLTQMRATVSATGAVRVDTLPDAIVDDLLRAFRRHRSA